jgi:uncharacterized protein YrrD
MLKSIKSVVGSKVVDFGGSNTLGEIVDWVMDPEEKKITAFLIRPSGWFAKLSAISSLDVIEYGPKLVVIKNPEVLSTPQEIMAHPKRIKQKIRLLGSPVVTTQGEKLGLVEDILFETIDASIQKIYVSPDLVNQFRRSDLIITANRIVEILANKIVVQEDGPETGKIPKTAGAQI